MDPEVKKKCDAALRLWEVELKTLEASQQLPNKGNYLIWRKSLLLKKALSGKMLSEVCYIRKYISHSARIVR